MKNPKNTVSPAGSDRVVSGGSRDGGLWVTPSDPWQALMEATRESESFTLLKWQPHRDIVGGHWQVVMEDLPDLVQARRQMNVARTVDYNVGRQPVKYAIRRDSVYRTVEETSESLPALVEQLRGQRAAITQLLLDDRLPKGEYIGKRSPLWGVLALFDRLDLGMQGLADWPDLPPKED